MVIEELIGKQSGSALKLQVARINSAQSRTASRFPFPVPTGGLTLKQKAINLLNTLSGLFIAAVHSTHVLESHCPPSCLVCEVNQSVSFTEQGM